MTYQVTRRMWPRPASKGRIQRWLVWHLESLPGLPNSTRADLANIHHAWTRQIAGDTLLLETCHSELVDSRDDLLPHVLASAETDTF
jgi:hypothetical protein